LIFGEVVKVHINQEYLKENSALDNNHLEIVGRGFGANWIKSEYFSMPNERPYPKQ
jgi:gamma-glutamylcysteine synthetase